MNVILEIKKLEHLLDHTMEGDVGDVIPKWIVSLIGNNINAEVHKCHEERGY